MLGLKLIHVGKRYVRTGNHAILIKKIEHWSQMKIKGSHSDCFVIADNNNNVIITS